MATVSCWHFGGRNTPRLPRPPVQSLLKASESLEIAGPLHSRLQAFCAKNDVTLFVLLLGAWNVLLLRYTGREDIVCLERLLGCDPVGSGHLTGCLVFSGHHRGVRVWFRFPLSSQSFTSSCPLSGFTRRAPMRPQERIATSRIYPLRQRPPGGARRILDAMGLPVPGTP